MRDFTDLPEAHRLVMRSAVTGIVDDHIMQLEAMLRVAQLDGDVDALDRLIHDDLLFTGPGGQLVTKAEDLALHRSRAVRFLAHTPHALSARRVGEDVVITSLRAQLQLLVHDAPVDGVFCYTRVWTREPSNRWRVVAGHVSAVGIS